MLRGSVFSLVKWASASVRQRAFHTTSAALTVAKNCQTIAVDPSEIEHHGKLAKGWWEVNGEMKGLHAMNSIRVPFIRDGIIATCKSNPELINTSRVLEGVNILEVGCGGGILTEQLGRLHANVIGLDLGETVIKVANEHLQNCSPELINNVKYKVEAIEVHSKDNYEKYDAVVLSEVLEHVTDKAGLLTSCVDALKPGGSIFITTLNKTFLAWLGGIVIAEYVFNVIPKGTHTYDKFVSPLEVQRILDTLNCSTTLVNGIIYDIFRNQWNWIKSTDLSYGLQAVKKS